MSRLWRASEFDRLSVGSFILDRTGSAFEPWAAGNFGGEDGDTRSLSSLDIEPQPDLIEQASRQAYDRGFQDGIDYAENEAKAKITSLERLIAGLECLKPCSSQDLGVLLTTVIDAVLRDTLMVSQPDQDLLRKRIQSAADMLADVSQPALLVLNPADAQVLDLSDLGLVIETNVSLERGSFRLLTKSGGIEDGPEVRLQQLKAAMEGSLEDRSA